MRLIWADRLAIVWLAFICIVFFLINGMTAIVGLFSYPHAVFIFFGIPWLFLRLVDWALCR